jgi:hypothetical protein
MLLKILAIHCIQALLQFKLCKADHIQLTYLMLQQLLSHLNDRNIHHSQVYILYVCLDLVKWCKIFILIILQHFSLLLHNSIIYSDTTDGN